MELRSILRLKVFCPPEYKEIIVSAIKSASPIRYGEYEGVIWTSSVGEEQFSPLRSAQPTIGEGGFVTALPSVKIEFSIPEDYSLLERIVREAIVPNHPWETPVVLVSTEKEVHLARRG